MGLTDEQICNMLELKDRLIEQLKKHQQEIQILEKNLITINSILKQSSFTKASSLLNTSSKTSQDPTHSIPITKGGDGAVIANVFVSPDQVSIILQDDIGVKAETPPLKTFFIDRIIGQMKRKDIADVENGKMAPDSVIDCILNKNSVDNLREIVIKNYRQKERINEIINSAGWSLSKMIENSQTTTTATATTSDKNTYNK